MKCYLQTAVFCKALHALEISSGLAVCTRYAKASVIPNQKKVVRSKGDAAFKVTHVL